MKTRKKRKSKKNKTVKKGPYSKDDFESGDGMLTTVWGPRFMAYTTHNFFQLSGET